MSGKNSGSKKLGRSAKSGRFVVTRGKDKATGETWVVAGPNEKFTSVVTTNSSGSTLDQITTKHSKALRNLAKK